VRLSPAISANWGDHTVTSKTKTITDHEFAAHTARVNQASDTLAARVAALQNENHYLRRANRVQPHLRLVLRAEAAANLIVLWWLTGYRIGRVACLHFGLSNDRWYAGRALLMAARLWGDDCSLTTNDPDTIQIRIAATVERSKREPSVIGYRIPISKRPSGFG